MKATRIAVTIIVIACWIIAQMFAYQIGIVMLYVVGLLAGLLFALPLYIMWANDDMIK